MKKKQIALAVAFIVVFAVVLVLAIKGLSIIAALFAGTAGGVLVWADRRLERERARIELEKQQELLRTRNMSAQDLRREILRSARKEEDK